MLNDQQDIHVEVPSVKQDLFAFLSPSFPPSFLHLSLSLSLSCRLEILKIIPMRIWPVELAGPREPGVLE